MYIRKSDRSHCDASNPCAHIQTHAYGSKLLHYIMQVVPVWPRASQLQMQSYEFSTIKESTLFNFVHPEHLIHICASMHMGLD